MVQYSCFGVQGLGFDIPLGFRVWGSIFLGFIGCRVRYFSIQHGFYSMGLLEAGSQFRVQGNDGGVDASAELRY